MLFRNKIKQSRSEHGVLQKELAALLRIDMPMMCKIERGEWRAKRKHVVLLADYFHVDKNEMLVFGSQIKCKILQTMKTTMKTTTKSRKRHSK